MVEQTLVLLKPDAVQRSILGEILARFERAGLKIRGMKTVRVDATFAMQHYTEDVAKRRGEHVRMKNVNFLTQGPVVALVLEGIEAVEVVRKLVGGTEPTRALPGTIRGDYAHMSYAHADAHDKPIPNLVHASATKDEAVQEVALWFTQKELHAYKTVNDMHVL